MEVNNHRRTRKEATPALHNPKSFQRMPLTLRRTYCMIWMTMARERTCPTVRYMSGSRCRTLLLTFERWKGHGSYDLVRLVPERRLHLAPGIWGAPVYAIFSSQISITMLGHREQEQFLSTKTLSCLQHFPTNLG